MDFIDSETYKNVLASYELDLQTSGKYALYANQSRVDGYQQIGNIFDDTSKNELEHAVVWLRVLNNGKLPNTLDNLVDAYSGPNRQRPSIYLDYAEIAEKEGFNDIAQLFRRVSEIEIHFNFRFEQLATNIQDSTVFCKDVAMVWICLKCGNLYWGPCAPEICPFCHYPQGYYQINCENY